MNTFLVCTQTYSCSHTDVNDAADKDSKYLSSKGILDYSEEWKRRQ